MNYFKVLVITLVASVLLIPETYGQVNSPQIIANDCDGTVYNLQNKLKQGKVIVIGWTMPCATCAPPLLSVHNAILNFAISHPNTVEYWVADDYANTNCSSVRGWCKNNGINDAFYFSTSAIKMSDFGSDGMPKVVVIGCGNGKVFYNVNNTPNGTGATAAINSALAEIGNGCAVTDVKEIKPNQKTGELKIFPNPSKDKISVVLPSVDFEKNAKVSIVNALGQIVFQKSLTEINITEYQFDIDISSLPESVYILRIENENNILNQRFIKSNNE